MFKFNFSSNPEDDKPPDTKPEIQWVESKEIFPLDHSSNIANSKNLKCGSTEIQYISPDLVIDQFNNTDAVLMAEQNHSDLVAGFYEGGLKIWECTFDLLDFMNQEVVDLKGKNVLDMGCGAGIIGLFSALNNSRVVYQDYNDEILKHVTIPNVQLNNIEISHCQFYSGDWQSFTELYSKKDDKFDLIFTSETIYNIDNYEKLLNVFKKLLKPSGVIYLAAKYYYFGVGGGIAQFQDLLQEDNTFNYTTTWECTEGVKRSIIKITFK